MTRDEILSKVKDVLEEALGIEEDEITPNASLTADLGAESIDYLDIQFRLEKEFSTDEHPFKVQQGELFPENLLENDEWVKDGEFTDEGIRVLRERMPHVDFSNFDDDRDVTKMAEVMTVNSLVEFVDLKLQRMQATA